MHLNSMSGHSYWPAAVSLALGSFLASNLAWWHLHMTLPLYISAITLITAIIMWNKDLNREATTLGNITIKTQSTMKMGFSLFIFSEVMFFFPFFWTYMHFSLNPMGDVGLIWPPTGINSLNPFTIPLLNTLILVSSGLTLTVSHHLLLMNRLSSETWLYITISLGMLFTLYQWFEYMTAQFTLASANYGSIFFMATGFHGAHVMIGSTLLALALMKLSTNQLNSWNHLSFEVSAWYWHFVDVVWLFLFILVYLWSK